MNVIKVSNIEAICLVLIIFVNHLILALPQTILSEAGSSSILSVIFVSIFAIIFVLLISKLTAPFINQDIIDIADYLGGKILKWIVGIISLIYLIVISSILLRDFTDFIKLVHFYRFPIYFILAFLLLIAIMGNFFGKKSTFRTNLIVVPIICIGLLINFSSLIPDYTFERIFPILGNGINQTFLLSFSNLSAFRWTFLFIFFEAITKRKQ